MKPLTERQMNQTLKALDLYLSSLNHTCWEMQQAGGLSLRCRWADFFAQSRDDFWEFNVYRDNERHQERLMLFATFIELKGVIP